MTDKGTQQVDGLKWHGRSIHFNGRKIGLVYRYSFSTPPVWIPVLCGEEMPGLAIAAEACAQLESAAREWLSSAAIEKATGASA